MCNHLSSPCAIPLASAILRAALELRGGAAAREERMKRAFLPGKTLSIRQSHSASEPRDQAIQVDELNVYTGDGAAIGTPDIVSDDEVVPARMGLPKRREIARIEFSGRPLALDRRRGLSAREEHEINLMLALVAPVADVPRLKPGMQLVQHEMLPQHAEIVV